MAHPAVREHPPRLLPALSAALAALLLCCASPCSPLPGSVFPRQTPINFLVRDRSGRPLRDVSCSIAEIISCSYGLCEGKYPNKWSVSGADGTLTSSVPFPGTFVMEFTGGQNGRTVRRMVRGTHPNQLIQVVL